MPLNGTLVVRHTKYSPDPASTLRNAIPDKQIKNLALLSVCFDASTTSALVNLLEDRLWVSVKFIRCSLPYNNPEVDNLLQVLGNRVTQIEWCHTTYVETLGLCLNSKSSSTSMSSSPTSATGITTNNQVQIFKLRQPVLSKMQAISLADGLVHNFSLQELDLSTTKIFPDAVQILSTGISCCTSSGSGAVALERLDVSNCKLSDESIVELCHAALQNHVSLTRLDMSGNKCESGGIWAIAALLQQQQQQQQQRHNKNRIQHLNMSYQQQSQLPPSQQPVAAAAAATAEPPTDTLYGLSNIAPLSRALQTNSTLVSLNLSKNSLHDQDAESLAFMLTNNTTLQELNLSFNEITDVGIQAFSRHLPRMNGLKRLALRPNPFSNIGGSSLLEGMRANVNLEYLDSLLSLQCSKEIRSYCHLNRGGRRLLLQDSYSNQVPISLWSLVLARVNKLSFYTGSSSSECCAEGGGGEGGDGETKVRAHVLYYLLQNGPVLWQRP
jgi:hypothetical protein